MVNSFAFHYVWEFWLIIYENLLKFCTRKCKKQHYVYCVSNDYQWFTLIPIIVQGKKPLNDNLQGGFGQKSKTVAPSLYMKNILP